MPEFTHNTDEMLDPNIFSQHVRLGTSDWRHKMKIAPFLEAENSFENIHAMCRYIVRQLDIVIEREKRWQDKAEGETVWYLNKLDDLRYEFQDYLTTTEDCMDLDDFVEEVDYRLTDLYDLADTKMKLKDGSLQRFLWVGAM